MAVRERGDIPIDVEVDGPQPDRPDLDAPTLPGRRVGVVAVVVVAALAAAAVFVGRARPSTDGTAAPTSHARSPTRGTSVAPRSGTVEPVPGVYVVVLGRRVLAGPSLQDLAPIAVMDADEPLPWVSDRWLVVPNGRLAAPADADAALWLIDLSGGGEPRRLAPPSRAVPSATPDRLWVQEGAVAQERTFDGVPLAAPVAVPGTLTGATTDGLVSEDRGTVTFTARTGATGAVGRGFTLDTDGTSVLWRAADGSLNRTSVPSLATRRIAEGTFFQRAWIAPAFVDGPDRRIDTTVVHGPDIRAAGFVEGQQLTVTGDGTTTVSDRQGESTSIGVLTPASEVRLIALAPTSAATKGRRSARWRTGRERTIPQPPSGHARGPGRDRTCDQRIMSPPL